VCWLVDQADGTLGIQSFNGRITMQNTYIPSSEAAIVGRLIKPDHGDFSPEAARELLSLSFGNEDQARLRELSLKAQEGTLTASEQEEIENYRRVGYWLGILWSKARLSVKRAGMDAPHEHRALATRPATCQFLLRILSAPANLLASAPRD
jgi:hypothetical protein